MDYSTFGGNPDNGLFAGNYGNTLSHDNVTDCATCDTLLTFNELMSLKRFTPVKDKRCLMNKWQHKPLTMSDAEKEKNKRKGNGIGLITGEFDGLGLLAIDFDGENAGKIAEAMNMGFNDNDTLSWSSGREGRCQKLYLIPPDHLEQWHGKTRKPISEYESVVSVKGEQLEIRYGGCQSVLPPSVHPETGHYKWENESNPKTLSLSQSSFLLSLWENKVTSPSKPTMTVVKEYDKASLNEHQIIAEIESALSFILPHDYHDWMKVGWALHSANPNFLDLWDKWSQGSEKYKSGECERLWSKFDSNGGIKLGTLFDLAKGFDQNQWRKDNLKSTVTVDTRNKLNKTLRTETDIENTNFKELNDFINKYADSGYNLADLQGLLGDAASRFKQTTQWLEKAILKKRESNLLKDDIAESSPKMSVYLNIPKETLNLTPIIGATLATTFVVEAVNIPTNPMALFTILLGAVSGVMGCKHRVFFRKGYTQPTILRTGIVSNSGQRKSPVASAICEPLQVLQDKLYDEYKHQKEAYTQDPDHLKPPIRKRVMVKDANIDGIYKKHEENPNGFLMFIDELAGLFNRMNKFSKGGGGDDIERDLELYDGKSVDKVRAGEQFDIYLKKTGVAVTGTIQWGALERVLNDGLDNKGISARWMFWGGELPLGNIPKTIEDSFIGETLADLYDAIYTIPSQDFILSEDAKDAFITAQNKLMIEIKQQPYPQVQENLSKCEGRYLRIAGVLHVIRFVCGIEDNLPVISKATMLCAIEVTNYYARQFEYISAKCRGDNQDSRVLKIIELVTKRGEMTLSRLKDFIPSLKQMSSDDLNKLLLNLIDNGQLAKVVTKKGYKVKLP